MARGGRFQRAVLTAETDNLGYTKELCIVDSTIQSSLAIRIA